MFKTGIRRSILHRDLSTRSPAPRTSVKVLAAGKDNKPREPWDFGRFLNTVLFFNPPPSPVQVIQNIVTAPIKVISGIAGQGNSAALQPTSSSIMTFVGSGPSPSTGIVMVTGATGGVGKRVVSLLLEQGITVRALVRDVEKAKELLSGLTAKSGAKLEVVAADITQRRTLLPEYFKGVSQVISCTAVKVAPKEGDTVDRSKYYQGIKFYDPEIVGDTPEAVEYKGMVNLLDAVGDILGREQGKALFAGSGGGAMQQFGSLDDVVMGGASSSSFVIRQGAGEQPNTPAGLFFGNVTTANNGGFASVRSRNADPAVDLTAYEGLELRIKGDGRRYKAILRTEAGWDGIGYTASFDTQSGVWQTIRLPFKDLVPVFRAMTVRNAAPLDVSSVYSLQLMHSKFEYDGRLNPAFKDGAFELPIDKITTYLPEPVKPKFVLVSSAGVTRPNRPGINVDEEPPAVKMNDMLGGLLTYKLKSEDALRASGVPFSIIRPVALTEEPAGAELQLDQGDTIRGKISRNDVAELCIALLNDESGLDTTFEIKSTVPFSQPWAPAEGEIAPRDWSSVLANAELKKGVTGRTVDGVYTGKQPESDVVGRTKAAV